MAVSYKELGLVNTRDMFKKAMKGGYAVPAFNFNNMEQLQAIIQACTEAQSPVILQVSSGARKYANQTLLRYMAQGAVEYAKELGKGVNIPISLHLDHGDTFELCKSCIETGFSSVMIDGSHHPYEKNIEETAKLFSENLPVLVGGKISGPEEKAVVIIKEQGRPCHIGIVAGGGYILHTGAKTGSVCQRDSHPGLRGRIEGYYRVR